MASVIEPVRDAEIIEAARPDLYEKIDGKIVECPPMSLRASRITSRLGRVLAEFVERHDLGLVDVEALFALPAPFDRSRRPDVMYFSHERWPKGLVEDPVEEAAPVVPDLAVEVVSPHDKADDVMEQIREYFLVGVRLVWVVYPRWGVLHVYDSFISVRVLTRSDDLEGGSVLPAFRLALATLLPEPA